MIWIAYGIWCVFALVIGAVVEMATDVPWGGLSVAAFLIGASALRRSTTIPVNPPTRGMLKIFGVPVKHYSVGPSWFILAPFCSVERIDAGLHKTEHTESVAFADGSEVTATIQHAFTVDPHNLNAYILVGGEEGVADALNNGGGQTVKDWLESGRRGPGSWEEAEASGTVAVNLILKHNLGEGLEHIPGDIPTEVLLHYRMGQKPTNLEIKNGYALEGGDWWAPLQARIDKLSPEQKTLLDNALKGREAEIKNLLTQSANRPVQSLGAIVRGCKVFISIAEESKKKVAKIQDAKTDQAAELVKATTRRLTKKSDAKATAEQLKITSKALPGLSTKEVLRAHQVITGVVKEAITTQNNVFDVGPGLAGAVGSAMDAMKAIATREPDTKPIMDAVAKVIESTATKKENE